MTEKKPAPDTQPIVLVTGMSGAGKSTVMDTLEDMGWEAIENIPLSLLSRLLEPTNEDGEARPIAIGIDSRSRGFDAERLAKQLRQLRELRGLSIELVFVDCGGAELEQRFSRTRRRHPLAQDRAIYDGITRERELLDPLKRHADYLVDTTGMATNALQQLIRQRFRDQSAVSLTVSIMSFGFSRGLPRNADNVFDMRFLRNPFWDATLKPLSGLQAEVGDYVSADPAFKPSIEAIQRLLDVLLPRYVEEGKSYLTLAFGCTGGRHRSVFVAELLAEWLRSKGFSPTINHRDIDLGDTAPAKVSQKTEAESEGSRKTG